MSTQLDWLNAPELPETKLVPAIATPCTPQVMCAALAEAWRRLFASEPKPESLAVLLSQWALETGRGKSCFAWNLGNARPPTTRSDALCCQLTRVSEILDGKEYFFLPPSRGSTFRAFESLDQGADFYLNLLHSRFAVAWSAVLRGDPAGYTAALYQAHYFTADTAAYGRTMQALFEEFKNIANGYEVEPHEIPEAIAQDVQSSWLAEFHPESSTSDMSSNT
jgi:hypothetical protein